MDGRLIQVGRAFELARICVILIEDQAQPPDKQRWRDLPPGVGPCPPLESVWQCLRQAADSPELAADREASGCAGAESVDRYIRMAPLFLAMRALRAAIIPIEEDLRECGGWTRGVPFRAERVDGGVLGAGWRSAYRALREVVRSDPSAQEPPEDWVDWLVLDGIQDHVERIRDEFNEFREACDAVRRRAQRRDLGLAGSEQAQETPAEPASVADEQSSNEDADLDGFAVVERLKGNYWRRSRKDRENTKCPTLARKLLWKALNKELGWKAAKIRDWWNGLDDDQRNELCPHNPARIAPKLQGRKLVEGVLYNKNL